MASETICSKRVRRSLFYTGEYAIQNIAAAKVFELPELERELDAESARKRPRMRLLDALVVKVSELSGRKRTMDEVAVLKFMPPVTIADARRYITAADQWMLLDGEAGNRRAHQVSQADAEEWISSLPYGCEVRAYTVASSILYLGRPEDERRAA